MSGVLDGGAKYLVHEQVGAGGMGAVHLGTMVSPAGERRVAIKQLLSAQDANEAAQQRIVQEARLVFQLTHTNICQVLDLAISDRGTFIVMEYVDGCDLNTLIRRCRDEGAPLDVAAAVHVAKEVAEALDYAHRRSDAEGRRLWLVHGDVTPQNILLSREGEVKLADFGIARVLGAQGPGNQLHAGTRGFIAPEATTGPIDLRADIYALGVTLYVALGGALLESGRVAASSLERPMVGADLIAILERALAERKEDRYATADELARDLSAYQARRFPLFRPASLGEVVRASTKAAPQLLKEPASLVSLTGTATFLSPMQFTGDAQKPLAAHGTERLKKTKRGVQRPLIVALALVVVAVVASQIATRTQNQAPPPTSIAPQSAIVAAPPPPKPSIEPVKEPTRVTAPVAVVAPVTAPAPARSRSRSHAKLKTSSGMSYLSVSSEPWGAVYVDGRKFADSTPVYRAPIASGKHQIWVVSPQHRTHAPSKDVSLRPGETRVVGFTW